MKPLRVLQISSSLAVEGPVGGAARFAYELAHTFERTVVAPTLLAIWDYHTPYEAYWLARLQQEGIAAFICAEWHEQSPYGSCVAALRGAEQLRLEPVDVVHSHGEFSDLMAIYLGHRLSARALVRTVHNEREWAKRPYFGRFFSNLVYPWFFAGETGVSQQVVNNLNRRPLARLRGRVAQVAYNAVNFDRFANVTVDAAHLRQSLGIPPTAHLVGAVGRLAPQKGYSFLLAAIPQVLAQQPDCYFLIIGDGALRAELAQQASGLGIAERVLFAGARHDVEMLYQVMDLLVLPSLWEGLPTVLLESMAAGIPVIATATSGSVELIEHEVTGLLTPVGDSVALAAALLRLLQAPALGARLSTAAKDRIQNRFAIQTIADQYAALYRKLAQR
jgi:glycosyltransferase involved in cell wall biosynthesis